MHPLASAARLARTAPSGAGQSQSPGPAAATSPGSRPAFRCKAAHTWARPGRRLSRPTRRSATAAVRHRGTQRSRHHREHARTCHGIRHWRRWCLGSVAGCGAGRRRGIPMVLKACHDSVAPPQQRSSAFHITGCKQLACLHACSTGSRATVTVGSRGIRAAEAVGSSSITAAGAVGSSGIRAAVAVGSGAADAVVV
eukprot:361767-Chlamydomonas_euryale.AAC.9